jgi:hypothetical protein
MQISVPETIYRVSVIPLFGFGPKFFEDVIHDSSHLSLDTIPLIDPAPIKMKQIHISLRNHVLAEFNEVSARRSCSPQTLINSALAEWLSRWYRGGQPIPFLEICKIIGLDSLMWSYDPEILYCYYAGVFGLPEEIGDTSFWSDPPFAWAVEMRSQYKKY